MEEEVKDLKEWLDGVVNFNLPDWKMLAPVPLYMEQVISYINEILSPLSINDKGKLTSFMVNNYVKAGMIKAPEKKKYTNEHLGYLIAISCLKDTLSMTDLSLLIEMDSAVSTDKSALYHFFKSITTEQIHDKAEATISSIERYERRYKKEIANNDPSAEKNLRDALALTAFRLAIQSQVNQIISKAILCSIAEDLHGEKDWQEVNSKGESEVKREMKISEAESERIANIKRKYESAKKNNDLKKENE